MVIRSSEKASFPGKHDRFPANSDLFPETRRFVCEKPPFLCNGIPFSEQAFCFPIQDRVSEKCRMSLASGQQPVVGASCSANSARPNRSLWLSLSVDQLDRFSIAAYEGEPYLVTNVLEIEKGRPYNTWHETRRGIFAILTARWNDSRVFHHQNHCTLGRPCPMNDPLRHDETLPRLELDCTLFKIDEQPSLDHVKEFVIGIVFVPMVFTLNHTKAHDRPIHLAKRLVVPLVNGGLGKSFLVDYFKRLVINVQSRVIWKTLGIAHEKLPPGLRLGFV
jgi:hypothetical protein